MATTSASYVVSAIFLLITGWYFSTGLISTDRADLNSLFYILPVLFLFFIPAVTMRAIAEEKKNGMIEQILTFPVSDFQYVIGKYLSIVVMFCLLMGCTTFYCFSIEVLGDPDRGKMAASYFSVFLLGCMLISIGVFASSATKDQVTSYIISFSAMFGLYISDKVLHFIPIEFQRAVLFIGSDYHYRNMLRGVIDSRDVIYFLTLILFFLYLSLANLERRKW